jgi:hypothetical protein
MLRASLLANAAILPQARQASYFFNRIGRFLPFTNARNRPKPDACNSFSTETQAFARSLFVYVRQ